MNSLKKISSLIGIGVFLLFQLHGQGQSNYLSQRISITVEAQTLEETLDAIAVAGDFLFSYNADLIEGKSKVSLDAENRSIERILKQLLGSSIRPIEVGHHVVLLNRKSDKESIVEEEEGYLLSGYIRDKETGDYLDQATIFDVNGNKCYSTNAKGLYEITFAGKVDKPVLNFCKAGYIDTLIIIEVIDNQVVDIALEPTHLVVLSKKDAAELDLKPMSENRLVRAIVPEDAQIISDNLSIYNPGSVQVSLLPFIGTNRLLKGSQIHRLSINILAGYSSGIKGVEVGGLLNIVKYDVQGVQLSGVGNLVGGNTKGTQIAGVFNANAGSMEGIQIAGFSNTINDRFSGVQVAGFSNFSTKEVDGIQVSGFSNVSLQDVNMIQVGGFINYGNNIKGTQAAGFWNLAKGNVYSAQISGAFNTAGNVGGLQLAGLSNIARDSVGAAQISGLLNSAKNLSGLQLSGFLNVIRERNKGVQISGFLNSSRNLHGLQLAPFNFADTVSKGVPIGVFSYVKKGYHVVEVGSNELFPVYGSFKTGIEKFYNIFSFSYHPEMIGAAYGYGSKLKFGKRFSVSLDLSGNLLVETLKNPSLYGVISRFNPSLNFKIFKSFVLTAGPSLNFYQPIQQAGDQEGLYDKSFYSRNTKHGTQQLWLGWNAGLRF